MEVDLTRSNVGLVEVEEEAPADLQPSVGVDPVLEGRVRDILLLDLSGALHLDEVPLVFAHGDQDIGPGVGDLVGVHEPGFEEGDPFLDQLLRVPDILFDGLCVYQDSLGEALASESADADSLIEAMLQRVVCGREPVRCVEGEPEPLGAGESVDEACLGEVLGLTFGHFDALQSLALTKFESAEAPALFKASNRSGGS